MVWWLKTLHFWSHSVKNWLLVQPPGLSRPLTCKALVLSGTCDVPAKSTALNMIGHNGFPYCEQPGRSLTVGSGCVHVYPYKTLNPDGPARTHSAFKKCAEEGYLRGERVKGINPAGSCLLTLPHYNIVHGMGIDYIHCILLNIVRLLVNLWFDSNHHSQAWSCSKLVTVTDKRLKSIRPPSVITKALCSLSERKYWKASEYRSWLFCYFLPVMLNFLPNDYYKHYASLYQAIYQACIKHVSSLKFSDKIDASLFLHACSKLA